MAEMDRRNFLGTALLGATFTYGSTLRLFAGEPITTQATPSVDDVSTSLSGDSATFASKMQGAAYRTMKIISTIGEYRSKHEIVAPENEVSALIGISNSDITSSMETSKKAKEFVALNAPAIAAWLVKCFGNLGLKENDRVAVTWSGSYVGYNVALAAAITEYKLHSTIIGSASASAWGANIPGPQLDSPGFIWIDIEKELYEKGLINTRTTACSIGGNRDLGINIAKPELLRAAIRRGSLKLLSPSEEKDPIEKRMKIFEENLNHNEQYKLLINCGGGVAASGGDAGENLPCGKPVTKDFLENISINTALPDCVWVRFIRDMGIPGLNLRSPSALPQLSKFDQLPDSADPQKVVSRR